MIVPSFPDEHVFCFSEHSAASAGGTINHIERCTSVTERDEHFVPDPALADDLGGTVFGNCKAMLPEVTKNKFFNKN